MYIIDQFSCGCFWAS